MENNIKRFNVTYKHPFTGTIVEMAVFAKSKKEAMKQALKSNVPTKGESFFWEIVSVEEPKGGDLK